uniref:Large ribosomal subunit protein bL20c n=3 Tax=Vischeria TaxID=44431 RepID=A0A5P8T095_9STRA|nr:ribosomal protein L20 [Vischeria sp. ACOI 3415]YP_010451162.1 ribosomal protein L20 [Vischeria punctata]AOW70934.1 ribosomal protein L20 [Vischeria sp. CAUP Q 202]QFR99752.1 ribosomal protein L20 [Vischeria stellata]QAA12183.1 ribosomal protein L20 [Vischeria sp. ACOI 3415]UTV00943.1 ribosomal protein L20 [Vischeria punctata]
MVRIKRGNVARKHRKKILELAKGYVGSHSRLFRIANQQVFKALKYSYSGRKNKKRWFRRLWISRINIGARNFGSTYSDLMYKIKSNNIGLNRKMLAHLAVVDPKVWSLLVDSTNK